MRLFFAIDFEASVKDAIAQAINAIPIEDPPWRWAAASNIHITLKFLGEMPEAHVAQLSECAEQVAAKVSPFSICLTDLGGFPDLSRPRVLFYRIDEGADALVALATRLDKALAEKMGIPREKRPFRAHATIARIKTPPAKPFLETLQSTPPLDGITQAVTKLVLVKSQLGAQGAKYYHLKEFALTKPK